MNITLIGMPGAGKSFIGKKLAEAHNLNLVELDLVTEKAFGSPLQQVVDSLGEEEFLRRQGEEAISFTKDKKGMVVSPGGSIIYTPRAMEHLKEISTVVYLKVPIEMIKERIGGVPRGIIGLNDRTFEELYDERIQLYEKWADHTIDGTKEPESVLYDIGNYVGLTIT